MDPVGWFASCRSSFVGGIGSSVEHDLAHLRAPGVVNADEQDASHDHSLSIDNHRLNRYM
jgi:hypothetical protein